MITDSLWEQYERDGFLRLGKVCSDDELSALQRRIDDIMLGKAEVDYARMLMQLDTDSGRYEDAPPQSKGFKGATLDYRKIQDLEYDPIFLAFMQRPIFREICGRVYGAGAAISCYRAMFMNKPARKGTLLPWHQDRWTHLDRDPLITLWAALDAATIANGCVEVIAGSHKLGVVNPSHGSAFLATEHVTKFCEGKKTTFIELAAGEAALLHNWLIHRSNVNRTDSSRRAFSVCYMDAATRDIKSQQSYPVIFGENALGVATTTSSDARRLF